jgi:SAM-dependent methyltransferase
MTLSCRFCAAALSTTFVDLGVSPLSNSFLQADQLDGMEAFYPLHAYVCNTCLLVQLQAFETPSAIFEDYAYFSSYSESWLRHAETYAAAMTERFRLTARSQIVELASNDGYLLQYFHRRGIPVLGIEPAANVAQVALQRGIPTQVRFFGTQVARELAGAGHSADLITANNVLAHVPDLNDFVAGLNLLLKPAGVVTVEFPHLLQLIARCEFDTIYHEHLCYFSLLTVERVFAFHGLTLFDVEVLSTHGGSLRVFARHSAHRSQPVLPNVAATLAEERAAGLHHLETYAGFGLRVEAVKRDLLSFLLQCKRNGKSVVGYGAPAKGNTLLNYCGVRTDFLPYTVDRNAYKQGRYLPGTRIPVHAPEHIERTQPDYVMILPWNLCDEIVQQMAHIRNWGGRFVTPIPEVRVLP